MTTTLTQLLADTRSHVDEETARLYSDVELTRWINEAVLDVARRAETLENKIILPTAAAVQSYAPPSNVLRLHKVEWSPDQFVTTYPLEPISKYALDSVAGTRRTTQYANPTMFTVEGWPGSSNFAIVLYPVPSQAGQMKVYYYQSPSPMVAPGDPATIPNGWEDLVPLYAEFVAKRKGAEPSWQEAKQLYEERLQHHIDHTRRWHDQADSFYTGANWLPEWLVSGDEDW